MLLCATHISPWRYRMKNVYFLNPYDIEEDLPDVSICISINGRMYFGTICPLELEKRTINGQRRYFWVARRLEVKLLSTDDSHIPSADPIGLGHAD